LEDREVEEPVVGTNVVNDAKAEEIPQPEEKKNNDNETEERYEAELIDNIQQFLYLNYY
jgi:hypothetical protein